MQDILFFCSTITPRLRYTVKLLFEDMLGLSVNLTTSHEAYINAVLPRVNFSRNRIATNEIHILPFNQLLFDVQTLKKVTVAEIKNFLQHTEGGRFLRISSPWENRAADLPLPDFLTLTFFFVTRYEEYFDDVPRDLHGRFESSASLANWLGFLQKPLVNEWAYELGRALLRIAPNLNVTFMRYQFQATYDIDWAWRFQNKGVIRNIGGMGKDLFRKRFGSLKKRLSFFTGKGTDPDFTFDYLEQLDEQHQLDAIYFWHLGDRSEFDKNIDWKNPDLQALISELAKKRRFGAHPSYLAAKNAEQFARELTRLRNITNLPITRSRHHFLRLHIPETYRTLLSHDITEDWTMGYADDIGFRASIAFPYNWYDLNKEEVTNLKIYPFAAMDVTLKNYLKLSPKEAVEQMADMVKFLRHVGGFFCLLWHNVTVNDLDDWVGWRKVYEQIVEVAKN